MPQIETRTQEYTYTTEQKRKTLPLRNFLVDLINQHMTKEKNYCFWRRKLLLIGDMRKEMKILIETKLDRNSTLNYITKRVEENISMTHRQTKHSTS